MPKNKLLTDAFADDVEGFSYNQYLHQVIQNGQLEAFKETIKELNFYALTEFLTTNGMTLGLKSVWTRSMQDELWNRK